MTACKDASRLAQLNTRLSKFSGMFDMAFTAGFAFYERKDLYNAIQGIINYGSNVHCQQYGTYFGMFFANLMNAKAPNAVFFNQVI